MVRNRISINKKEFEDLVVDGYKAQEIAEYFGCSPSYISRWVKKEYKGDFFTTAIRIKVKAMDGDGGSFC